MNRICFSFCLFVIFRLRIFVSMTHNNGTWKIKKEKKNSAKNYAEIHIKCQNDIKEKPQNDQNISKLAKKWKKKNTWQTFHFILLCSLHKFLFLFRCFFLRWLHLLPSLLHHRSCYLTVKLISPKCSPHSLHSIISWSVQMNNKNEVGNRMNEEQEEHRRRTKKRKTLCKLLVHWKMFVFE